MKLKKACNTQTLEQRTTKDTLEAKGFQFHFKNKGTFFNYGGEATENIINFAKALLLNRVCRQGLFG